MLNKYPLWKYLLVLFVIMIGLLYASPNLYRADPAVQISGEKKAVVDLNTLDTIKKHLTDQNIPIKSISLEYDKILARFDSVDTQIKAKDAIEVALGDESYITALNLAPTHPEWLRSLGANPMKLGLDLRGGVHFLMEVDMKEAMDKATKQLIDDFKSDLRESKIRYRTIKRRQGTDMIDVVFREEKYFEKGKRLLEKRFPDIQFIENDKTEAFDLRATLTEQRYNDIQEYAVMQNITIMRNRVNQLGVAEPQIQRQGANRIVVELPGVQDSAQAKKILSATATLEFRIVDTKHDVRDALNGAVPPGSELFPTNDGTYSLLKKRIILDGSHITDAQSGFDENGMPQVSIKLDSKGGTKMSQATKDNVGNLMATLFIEYKPTKEVDEKGLTIYRKEQEVINQARINQRLNRSFRITGIDSQVEADNLAMLLRAGALVAPIRIVQESTIGPSLGQENIERGINAVVLGFALVLAFMVVYYRGFGLVANAALGANLVMIIGIMSMIPGATLTLPGIAGIVLTVGMAVDANVLIFERIREELREGRSPQSAIHHGYDSAFSTIADANITTFIAAVILFAIGSGPVKGFAVTLSIGIATSMFTAIVGTRSIVNFMWGGKPVQKLSI